MYQPHFSALNLHCDSASPFEKVDGYVYFDNGTVPQLAKQITASIRLHNLIFLPVILYCPSLCPRSSLPVPHIASLQQLLRHGLQGRGDSGPQG